MMPRLGRQARRILPAEPDRLHASGAARAAAAVHRALAPREEESDAAMSEPVKPITYYVDPATPKWLMPFVKNGIEDWQPAFEEAGFRHGIVARDAPTKAEDPDWSPEDARYSVVRWLPSDTENAHWPERPRPADRRDPRGRHLHVPQHQVAGRAVVLLAGGAPRSARPAVAVAGFADRSTGRSGSSPTKSGTRSGFSTITKAARPTRSTRSAAARGCSDGPLAVDHGLLALQLHWCSPRTTSTSPTSPAHRTLRQVRRAVGLHADPGREARPTTERATLDQWSREQDATPWLRSNVSDFSRRGSGDQSEAVGDADPVKATGWGLKSIKQIVPLLIPATTGTPGDSYADLQQTLWRPDRPVAARDGTRGHHGRRDGITGEARGAGGRPVHAAPSGAPACRPCAS